ncbi:BspA family leucine-rich repeat surface protein, partial [Segatella copri]|uniref:BspA family leucine-rich repeat surface protein n=1 Tax=Segatella copri TaxID=165179 RepID=UPI000E4D7AD7
NCTSLETISGLEYLNTANITDMGSMFQDCYNLKSLDLTKFDTKNVSSMYFMFYNCPNLTSLDLTNFNAAKVTDMHGMFNGCSALISLDLTNFNAAKVTDMHGMFNGCSALISLDLTNFNAAKVTDMHGMFNGCSALISLDLTNFNAAKVTDMHGMFNGCSALISLDLTNFNTAEVRDMNRMFYMLDKSSTALTTIYVSDNFVTTNVQNGEKMFKNCTKLKGFQKYSLLDTDHRYANYKTGYFTKLVGKNGEKKIGATGETLATENLVLDDGKDFVAYDLFAAKNASYSRDIPEGSTWGTLCLPFAIDQSKETECKFYSLTGIDADNKCITLESCEEGIIPAGTPVLFKMNEGVQTLNISVQDAGIVKEPVAGTNTDVKLVGSFTKIGGNGNQGLAETDYIIGKDKFWLVSELNDGNGVGIKPMRAYIHPANEYQARAAMLSIGKGDGTTAIDNLNAISNDANAEYYDANGRRTNGLQKGLNIVKRGSKTYKIMVK